MRFRWNVPRWMGGFVVCMWLGCVCSLVFAQSSAGGASSAGAPEAPQAVAQATSTSANSDEALSNIQSDFAALKVISYAAVVIGAALGLVWFVRRRRAYVPWASLTGLLCTLLVAAAIFGAGSAWVLSADGRDCSTASLEVGEKARKYDLLCRQERESAANGFGVVHGFRAVFVSSDKGTDIPLAGWITRTLAWSSVLLFAGVLYVIGRLAVLRSRLIKA
jgi:hypothetical protein